MFKQTTNSTQSLRFRRWSRKSYAVFVSLHKVVSIGALVVSVADKSLVKAASHVSNFVSNLLFDNQEASDTEFDELETTSNNFILQTLTIQQRTDAAAAGAIGIYPSKRATYKGESPRMIALFLSQIKTKLTAYQSYTLFLPLFSRFTAQAYEGWDEVNKLNFKQ